jgi:hypothetical protein
MEYRIKSAQEGIEAAKAYKAASGATVLDTEVDQLGDWLALNMRRIRTMQQRPNGYDDIARRILTGEWRG